MKEKMPPPKKKQHSERKCSSNVVQPSVLCTTGECKQNSLPRIVPRDNSLSAPLAN